MSDWVVPLAIVAGILGAVELVRSKGQSLVAWGLVALAVALVILKT